MADIKIVVATTKKYRMPDDSIYLPLHVGAKNTKTVIPGYERDDNGADNISEKNPQYCELTGLYWAWKNLDADYVGLVHYRRYFGSLKNSKATDVFDRVLGRDELEELLKASSVIVPAKRKYYIETLQSHYAHTHYEEQLTKTKKITEEKYPEYLESYERVMEQTSGHMFNMMIMKKDIRSNYCEWLFDILGELEGELKDKRLDPYQGRYIGRVGELIFNVWLDYQITTGNIPRYRIKELPCIHMEHINWVKKGYAFLSQIIYSV